MSLTESFPEGLFQNCIHWTLREEILEGATEAFIWKDKDISQHCQEGSSLRRTCIYERKKILD